MGKFKVVLTDKRRNDYSIEEEILSQCDADLVLCDCKNEEELKVNCRDADGILVDMALFNYKNAFSGLIYTAGILPDFSIINIKNKQIRVNN